MLYRVIKYGVSAIVLVFISGAYATGGGGGDRLGCEHTCQLVTGPPIIDVVPLQPDNCDFFCTNRSQTCRDSAGNNPTVVNNCITRVPLFISPDGGE